MIRKITESDRALYTELAKEFYATDAVLSPIPEKNIADTFDEMMRSDCYAAAYIFEEDGETAGYGQLAFTWSQEAGGKTVWLEEIYLRPAFRGKGIGSGFIEFVKSSIPAARYRLETEPDNLRAQALYERRGFGRLEYISYITENGK